MSENRKEIDINLWGTPEATLHYTKFVVISIYRYKLFCAFVVGYKFNY